jgi:hypothetical protein
MVRAVLRQQKLPRTGAAFTTGKSKVLGRASPAGCVVSHYREPGLGEPPSVPAECRGGLRRPCREEGDHRLRRYTAEKHLEVASRPPSLSGGEAQRMVPDETGRCSAEELRGAIRGRRRTPRWPPSLVVVLSILSFLSISLSVEAVLITCLK